MSCRSEVPWNGDQATCFFEKAATASLLLSRCGMAAILVRRNRWYGSRTGCLNQLCRAFSVKRSLSRSMRSAFSTYPPIISRVQAPDKRMPWAASSDQSESSLQDRLADFAKIESGIGWKVKAEKFGPRDSRPRPATPMKKLAAAAVEYRNRAVNRLSVLRVTISVRVSGGGATGR